MFPFDGLRHDCICISSDLWYFLNNLRYEPYLWENERQSYLRHAVLFGFFVQLNRMYTDTIQKLLTNSESNIMRCSVVPRFKYLPIRSAFYSSFLCYTFFFSLDSMYLLSGIIYSCKWVSYN